ncbi:MAG: redoxin family protein [Bacteroidota bacterium]|nr:redoxin family protein [Bacteroidota bacterium]MDX5430585.1 redoxin family protein [Bacteroidota bacterium]MDX5469337.1 redoxin family protein [Bacteroidota bacterium]
MKKYNALKLKEMDQKQPLFYCWGYNYFLNKLLEDYFIFTMSGFDYPFRTYKPTQLEKFIFEKEIFNDKELSNYLSFYKIKELEYANQKPLLFYFADSLLTLTSDQALKKEIEVYVGKSYTRIQPKVKAPDFLLRQLGSDILAKRSDFEGKVLILDFWATWCGPCVKSFKSVSELSKKYQDSVEFVSISLDDNPEKAEVFLKKNPDYTWTFLYDGKNGATGVVYEAFAIPKYVIIDETGIIVKEFYSVKEVEKWLDNRFN